jgi:hypothetical protein
LLQTLVKGQEAVFVGVPFGEAFGSGGGLGLVGGVVFASEFTDFIFVDFVKLGGTNFVLRRSSWSRVVPMWYWASSQDSSLPSWGDVR